MTEIDSGLSPVEQLMAQTTLAADIIARQEGVSSYEGGLDQTGADMIVSNLVVLLDRVTDQGFANVPKGVQDQVVAVAIIARDVTTSDSRDLEMLPGESEFEHGYRTGIVNPIQSLQLKLHIGDYDPKDQQVVSRLRFGVQGSGLAFAALLGETKHLPAVAETISYFFGNANAATNRARMIAQEVESKKTGISFDN